MLDYLVLYASETGNTRRLATEIFSALPGSSKDLLNVDERFSAKEAVTYYIGFWTNCGACGLQTLDFLSGLHGKRIALFGTCGLGNDDAYRTAVLRRIKAFIPEDNEYIGGFLCQGKMPIQVRRKYENLAGFASAEDIKKMLDNFDEALLHPDAADLENARNFARETCAIPSQPNRYL